MLSTMAIKIQLATSSVIRLKPAIIPNKFINRRIARTNYNRKITNPAQSGFAMPIALGLGLVMIIFAASMIGRSQSDQLATNSQREINRALSVADAGVIRVQSFLDQYKFLATKNLDQWSSTLDLLPSTQANCRLINPIAVKQQAGLFKNNTWIDLDPADHNKGRYQIVDYHYQNGIGKLTVAGEIDVYNTTHNSSHSTLTIDIPIGSESAKIAPPALWANTFNLNINQKITGQIQATACPQLASVDPDGIVGIDLSNLSLISGTPSGEIIADPFTPLPAAKIAPNTAISLPAITSSVTFPRPYSTDLPDVNGEYNYVVDIDNPSSGYSIKLHNLDLITINIAANQKVNLYLKGNLDLAGSQTVNVNSAHPNLRIYGSSQTTKLTIADTASITAFIHAPFADAQSISANPPNSNQRIVGAIWVKSWDSATSPNQIPIIQAGNWADFGIPKIEQPAQLSPISYWQRVEN
jgi:hypothetical protein